MYVMGVDIGSTASKGILLNADRQVIASAIINSGTGTSGPSKMTRSILGQAGITSAEIGALVATGYGRMRYPDADRQISELSCHARGVHFLLPEVRTIIDIGGQDAKALALKEGKLQNFVMNDKCAAGTGRFLDVMAKVLEVPISSMGLRSAEADRPVSISSTCTVFAESEVISHLANDESVENILAGIHDSVAKRVSSLAKRVGVCEQVALVGGVAQNQGVVHAMEQNLGVSIQVPDLAQLTGALGAALYAREMILKQKGEMHCEERC